MEGSTKVLPRCPWPWRWPRKWGQVRRSPKCYESWNRFLCGMGLRHANVKLTLSFWHLNLAQCQKHRIGIFRPICEMSNNSKLSFELAVTVSNGICLPPTEVCRVTTDAARWNPITNFCCAEPDQIMGHSSWPGRDPYDPPVLWPATHGSLLFRRNA